jgi:ATP-binding cassette subfamily C protein
MLRTIGQSWGLLSNRQKTALALLSSARVLANGLDVLGIAMIGAVGALALGSAVTIPFLNQLNIEPGTLLVGILLAAGAVFFFKTALGVALSRATMFYLAKIETLFSLRIAESIFSGTLSHLKKQSRPEIEWSILRSTHIAFPILLGQAMALVAEASLALLVFGFLFFTDWPTAIAVTLYFSLILAVFQLYSQRILTKAGSEFSEGSVAVNQAISNLTNAFREIKVLSKTSVFMDSLAKSKGQVARAAAINLYLAAIPRLIVEVGLISGAIGFVAFQYLQGDGLSSPIIFGVFLMGSLRMMSALLPLQRAFMAIKFQAASAAAAQDLLAGLNGSLQEEEKVQQTDPPSSGDSSARAQDQGGYSVSLQNLSFEYDDAQGSSPVLHNISLSITPGSVVAFIGPSGAGKSTLIDVILGLNQATSGTVECSKISPVTLRTLSPGSISYVPQKPGLVSGTIEQNIALGVPIEEIDQVALWDAIASAKLTELVASLPDGVKSSLGKQSDSLSGGQLQRLGLARALYTKPRLLVLDEATSALDAETEATISESLALLKGHTTLVVVAHRLSTVQKADVIHVLDQGRIIASGTFQELRKGSPLVKKYVRMMSFDE